MKLCCSSKSRTSMINIVEGKTANGSARNSVALHILALVVMEIWEIGESSMME